MLLKITGVVQNPENFNPMIMAAIDQTVSGTVYNTESGPGTIAAKAQMIDPHAFRKFRTLLRAGTLGVVSDIA